MASQALPPRRRLRAGRLLLALAVSFAGLGPAACGDRQLRKISAPREGVHVRYAFEPATAYDGKLAIGITRQVDGVDKPIRQAISGDVTMVVLGTEPDGGTRVRVTLTSGDLDWALLPDSGYSREQFLKLAAKRLKGMHIPLTIGPRGGVTERPAVPDDVPDELAEVLAAVIDAVTVSFVSVPEAKVSRGARWVPPGPGRLEGVFKGLFRHVERDEEVARFELEMTKIPIGADEAGERQGTQEALFAVAGYPARVDLECRDFDPRHGMSFRRVQVEWTKVGAARPDLAAPREEGPRDVQVISDPCNPDYVGPLLCDEEPDAIEEVEAPPDDDDDDVTEDDDDDDAP
jgi:hypothetical protein